MDLGDIFFGGAGAVTGFLVGGPWGFLIGGLIGLFFGGDLAQEIIGGALDILAKIIALIGQVFFAIAAALIKFALKLNAAIAQSETIRLGHDVVLAFANLGLVAGIIVIAFLVMFRRADVGQLLTRFIVAALLINFSFFIVTQVFIAPVDAVTSILNQASRYEWTSFAKIFNPQIDPIQLYAAQFPPEERQAILELIEQSRESGLDIKFENWRTGLGVDFAGFLFVVAFTFIGTITLFAVAAMLFVRYMALGLLIILMPLAWLAWVFPNLKIPGGNPWTQWWNQFTRWLLFAPAMMFFIFLSVRLVNDPSTLSQYQGTDIMTQVLSNVGDMLIVVGLLVGGLIVANNMSITGSSYAMAVAKKGGAWAKAKGGQMAFKGATFPLATKRGKQSVEKMQQTPGLRFVGRQLNTLGAKREIAVKNESEQKLKALLEVAKKNPDRLVQAIPSLRGDDKITAYDFLVKKGLLHKFPKEKDAPGNLAEYLADPKTKKIWERLGRGGDYGDLTAAAEMGEEAAQLALIFSRTGEGLEELEKAIDEFQKKTYKTAKDVAKIQPGIYASGERYGLSEKAADVVATRTTEGILRRLPSAMAGFRPKMDAEQHEKFQGIVNTFIDDKLESDPKDPQAFNLPQDLRGIKADVKKKLVEIDEQGNPELSMLARKVYRLRQNLAGLVHLPGEQREREEGS